MCLGQKQPWNPGRCLLVRMTGRGRAGPISRLPSIWSRYLAAWESTWYPGWAEQHADYLVITSLHISCRLYVLVSRCRCSPSECMQSKTLSQCYSEYPLCPDVRISGSWAHEKLSLMLGARPVSVVLSPEICTDDHVSMGCFQ